MYPSSYTCPQWPDLAGIRGLRLPEYIQRELHALKSDKLVPLEWVADHWSVDIDTARKMIQVLSGCRPLKAEIKVLSYGHKIVRYRRSDIERITNENLVPLKDMLAQKRVNWVERTNRVSGKE